MTLKSQDHLHIVRIKYLTIAKYSCWLLLTKKKKSNIKKKLQAMHIRKTANKSDVPDATINVNQTIPLNMQKIIAAGELRCNQ